MARLPKHFRKLGPTCPIDDDFFRSLEEALGTQLNDNARILIAFSLYRYIAARAATVAAANATKKTSNQDPNTLVFVDVLLGILEEEPGIIVRASKRAGRDAHGLLVGMPGPIPAFLRVIWKAVPNPDRDANGFARLASNCSESTAWLVKTQKRKKKRPNTVETRRHLRTERRAPRKRYDAYLRNAWKK